MARLPVVGSDTDTWGDELNGYIGGLWHPRHHGFKTWTSSWAHSNQLEGWALDEGYLELWKLLIPEDMTISDFCWSMYGLGEQDPEEIYWGLYGISGMTATLLGVNDDITGYNGAVGPRALPLTEESAGSLDLEGGPDNWVYAAGLGPPGFLGVGGQPYIFEAVNYSGFFRSLNAFITPAMGFRHGLYGDGTLTALPSTFDIEDVNAPAGWGIEPAPVDPGLVLIGLR